MKCDIARVEPMTLGNIRQLGVRSLKVACSPCRHAAVLDVSLWPDDVVVPWFGRRMVYTECGSIGVDARPNRKEQRRGA